MQYMQQALMRDMKTAIESDPLCGLFAHFSDQSLNQEAARRASVDGSLATLDLSEASDRVLNRLVEDMLMPWPDLLGAVQACRSTTVDLGDGRKTPIVKFASMGSALTFPVEEIVFTTLVFMGIAKARGLSLRHRKDFVPFVGDVHVYGDDMIVPVDSVNDVTDYLEAFGLLVNHRKSFAKGNFRESCGGDFFDGVSVKPIRLKTLPPARRQDVPELLAWNAMMNAAFAAGLVRTGSYVQGVIERAIGQALPLIPETSGAIGIHTPAALCVADRMSPILHRPEVLAYVPSYPDRKIGIDGVWALQKALTGDWTSPENKDHLLHSGKPLTSRIKMSWVPIY